MTKKYMQEIMELPFLDMTVIFKNNIYPERNTLLL